MTGGERQRRRTQQNAVACFANATLWRLCIDAYT